MTLDDTPLVNPRPKHRPKAAALRGEMHRRHGITRGTSGPIACAYCGVVGIRQWTASNRFYGVGGAPLELDHVAPYVHGGPDEANNMEWACNGCNLRKGSLTYWTSPNGFLVNGKRTDAARRGVRA